MKSRMDKYKEFNDFKRTTRNLDLYDDINQNEDIDLDSNVLSIDVDPSNIDIDKIRGLLDSRVNENKRKSNVDEEIYETRLDKYNTKQYDINKILNNAKSNQNLDYEEERLKKVANTNNHILEGLKEKGEQVNIKRPSVENEAELLSLINTITEVELQNKIKKSKEGENLLKLLNTKTDTNIKKEPITKENSFYTGNLLINEDDFDDFKDIEKEIKSNSILINILIVIFSAVLIAILVFFMNQIFELGWF